MEILKTSTEWMSLEQPSPTGQVKRGFTIGLPAEQDRNESRIVLTPLEVSALVEQGHKVIIERNLGARTCYTNQDFAGAGAIITENHSEAFFADIVLRVSLPDLGEIELMKSNAVLISSIKSASKDEKYFRALLKNKITAISFEHIRTEHGEFPLYDTIQEIAGHTAVMVASSLLADGIDGQGKSLSGFAGIAPAEALILGSNMAAFSAVNTAYGMGASVKILDRCVAGLSRIREKARFQLYTDTLNAETLSKILPHADIVICTLQFKESRPEFFVPVELIREMKKGAVIVDLSIDCGGSFETSRPTMHSDPVFKELNVTHYCVPNITALVSNTTTLAFSNFLAPALHKMGREGHIDNFLLSNLAWMNGVYTYKGYATNIEFSERYDLPYKEIDLLMTIFNK
ncbi:MAG: hypothetical protein LBH92_06120 [Bacteroidales bacterium]|jgi:alanine dehydrogenase|nr:hypothetical protein [Bacteroidales bacterium]